MLRRPTRCALLFLALAGLSAATVPRAEAQGERTFPLAKFEAGFGLSPMGAANGFSGRAAVAIFPTRLGVIARITSHQSASGTRAGLLNLGPPEKRIIDRAVMLGGHVETEVDALFTVAIGVGQLWGEKLSDDNARFVELEQHLGLAAEIGAYMPTQHSGLGTVIVANATRSGFVVGFVVTFYAGF